MSLVDYDDSSEDEVKESAPKKARKFVVPVKVESLQKKEVKTDVDIEEEQEKAKRRQNVQPSSGILSFLPKPKNAAVTDDTSDTSETSTSDTTEQKPTQSQKPKAATTKKRIPLSFKQTPLFKHELEEQEDLEPKKQEDSTEPSSHTEDTDTQQEEEEVNQQYYQQQQQQQQEAQQDYSQYNAEYAQQYATYYSQQYDYSQQQYAQQYPQQYGQQYAQQYAQPAAPAAPLPREFQDMYGKNIVDIYEADIKKDLPKFREPDQYSDMKPQSDFAPSRTHRRQGHLQFLLWDAQHRAEDLENRRINSMKNKRESRSKYGW